VFLSIRCRWPVPACLSLPVGANLVLLAFNESNGCAKKYCSHLKPPLRADKWRKRLKGDKNFLLGDKDFYWAGLRGTYGEQSVLWLKMQWIDGVFTAEQYVRKIRKFNIMGCF
jgi:hypothetical protein